MMHTLCGFLILRVPLQPWGHVSFTLPIKKAPSDTPAAGDCPIVPPPATLCRYRQNRLSIVRYRPAVLAGQSASTLLSMGLPCRCKRTTAHTWVLPVSNVFALPVAPPRQCRTIVWNRAYLWGRVMKPLALDTPLHVEKLWIAGLRDRGPLWRLRRMVDMTSLCWHAAYGACQRAQPGAATCIGPGGLVAAGGMGPTLPTR